MFQTIIEAFIEKHRALLPEQCQEELRVLWSALTTAYQGEVIRSAKARQEVVDAIEALKAKTELAASLRWGVFIKGTIGRAAKVPIASFEYADMAGHWAKYNYPRNSEVRDMSAAQEEGATNGSKD